MGWRSSIPALKTWGARRGNTVICAHAPSPSPPAREGQVRGGGRACSGRAICTRRGARARPGPARARHAAGAEQGLPAPGRIFSEVWVSSLGNRLDSFPWATVRYLFNLAVQPLRGRPGGMEAGRGEAGGDGEPKGKPFFPPHRPWLSRSLVESHPGPPDRGGQPTPWLPGIMPVHSHRLGDEETREEPLVQGPRARRESRRCQAPRLWGLPFLVHQMSTPAPRCQGSRQTDFWGKPQRLFTSLVT